MTKAEFLAMFAAMYRVANLSDSDSEAREDWTKPEMASLAGCVHLDRMARGMVEAGVLTQEEVDVLYAEL